jgi:hypothetical protein
LNFITSKYANIPSSFVYGPAKNDNKNNLFKNKILHLPSPPPSIIGAPIEVF